MKRTEQMQQALDNLTQFVYGLSNSDAGEQNICIACKQPVREFRDERSVKEYQISRLCQACQDKVFTPPDD
jgi:hypothetical protein